MNERPVNDAARRPTPLHDTPARRSAPALIAAAAVLVLFLTLFTCTVASLQVATDASTYNLHDTVSITVTGPTDNTVVEIVGPDNDTLFIYVLEPAGNVSNMDIKVPIVRPGAHRLYAFNGTSEASTAFEVTSPDLAVTALNVGDSNEASKGRPVNVTGTVRNVGSATAMATISLYIDEISNGNLIDTVNTTIDADGSYTYEYEWTPSVSGWQYILLDVESMDPPEWTTGNNTKRTLVRVSSEAAPEDEGILDAPSIAIIVVSTSAAASLGAIWSIDRSRYAFLTFIMPMYSRINRKKVLDQEVRGMVFGFIVANSGVTYSQIRNDLNLANGTLTHHLQMLEKTEKVTSVRDGIYRRFYVKGQRAKPGKKPLSRTQMYIADFVRENPGTTQDRLIEALDMARSTASYNLRKLQDDGIVTTLNGGKTKRYVMATKETHHCPSCGARFDLESADFCPKCGARMGDGH